MTRIWGPHQVNIASIGHTTTASIGTRARLAWVWAGVAPDDTDSIVVSRKYTLYLLPGTCLVLEN